MKIFGRILDGLVLLLVVMALWAPSAAYAQVNTLTSTTLSSALGTASTASQTGLQKLIVASATGITAPSVSAGSIQLYIDRELLDVTAVNGTTIFVHRGAGGTLATTHASGAVVWIGSPNFFKSRPQSGSCSVASEYVHPVIDVKSGWIYRCADGAWVGGPNISETLFSTGAPRFCTIGGGGGVALATAGTNTTLSAATSYQYIAEVDIPRSMLLTGISVLAGGTAGGANHWEVALYTSSGGAVVAQSATATSASSTNAFLDIPFASTYYAVGPARYWIAFQSDGTTDKIQTVAAANSFANVLTAKPAATAYGTFPALTAPTTFVDAVGPVACVY